MDMNSFDLLRFRVRCFGFEVSIEASKAEADGRESIEFLRGQKDGVA